MGHLTLSSSTTMLSHSVLVAVICFSLTAQHTDCLATEDTTTEKDVQDVKCPHLPCPFPGNCTHKVWSHFWYHGKLCKGCQYCVNVTVTASDDAATDDVQDVKCPHLPCPFPGNCTHKVWSHFWYHGKLCKGCQYCVNVTVTASDDAATDTSPTCPHLPCPPPFPNCARFEWTHFKYEGKVCQGCQMCVYWNISKPAARQVHHQCPMFKCPAPGPCDTPFSVHEVTMPGVPHTCPGCPYCPSESSPVKRLLETCPDVSCVEPGPCNVPLKTQTLRIDHRDCPGCLYCPQ